jgi:Ca2+:H+ antiporter
MVVIIGFWFSHLSDPEAMGVSRFDIMTAGGSFKTAGRGKAGYAFQQ